MSRIWLSLAVRSRLAIALLLLGGLLCFGLGQVLGHSLTATPPSPRVAQQTQAAARQIGTASGALAATPASTLSQPLAAPPVRTAVSAGPPAHHNNHAKGKHHQGNSNGGAGSSSKHGSGHHQSNGSDHGGNGNGHGSDHGGDN